MTIFVCACGGNHVTRQYRLKSRTAACMGWRPTPTAELEANNPLVWALVQDCWRPEQAKVKGALASVLSFNEMAKRPSFTDIVQRLESMRPSSHEIEPMPSSGTVQSEDSLQGFATVTLTEIRQVEDLLDGLPSLRVTPSHIGGSVALLRIVRYETTPLLRRKFAKTMLQIRVKLGSDAKASEILEQGLSLHTLPGRAERQLASWETNECVGANQHGDIVVLSRLGAIQPTKFLNDFSLEDFKRHDTYNTEGRAMMLDLLSRRAMQVVHIVYVLDTRGVTLAHRKLMP